MMTVNNAEAAFYHGLLGEESASNIAEPHGVGSVGGNIRVATFNIQIFGKTKAAKPEVMDILAGIIRQYTIVAVQEIKDVSNEVPQKFLEKINADGSQYDMLVSLRTGRQGDDMDSQEQYAFYFNPAVIQAVDEGRLFDDADRDLFQREPFVARFRAVAGNLTFVLIAIHTAPESAIEEIAALDDVIAWARHVYPQEDDFIALGDFNASCDYAPPGSLDGLAIRGSTYTWIVPDDANTNLASEDCAYDRIIVTSGVIEDFTQAWGVDRAFTDKKVSDHWPVWVEFFVNHDSN